MEGFPGGSVVKNLPANAGDTGGVGSTPGMGRSPGGGNGNPLQDSCWENPMDRGAWRATVHGVAERLDCAPEHTHTHTHTHAYTAFCFSIHRLMNVWVVSIF